MCSLQEIISVDLLNKEIRGIAADVELSTRYYMYRLTQLH